MPIIIKFTHFSGVDTPICPECQALDMTFFNPECFGCQSELRKMADHGIGIASIMAVLRQWIPMVLKLEIPSTKEANVCFIFRYSNQSSIW